MKKFLWVDLEMTGLDEKTHHILEVAAIITDAELKILANKHEIPYQVLIRVFILDGLERLKRAA